MFSVIGKSIGNAAAIVKTIPVQLSSQRISNSGSFTSLPIELIYYIVQYLSPKDIGNLRLCSRDMYYRLSGREFNWYQTVFQHAMLQMNVRISFFIRQEDSSCYQGRLNEMSYVQARTALAHMRQIIKNQFINMTIYQKGKIFKESAKAGCTEILTAMANSPGFFDIRRVDILSSFRAAAIHGQIDVLKIFLNLHTRQLCVLNKCSIETAVVKAAASRQNKVISEISGWDAFGKPQVSTIVQAARLAINNDDPVVMKELMRYARFYNMNDGEFFSLFAKSVQEGRLQVVQLFLQTPAFLNRIGEGDFELVFLLSFGSILSRKEIVKEFICCHRFNDISPEYLGRALVQTARYKRGDLFYAILNSRRFHEISFSYFDEMPHRYKEIAYANAKKK